MRYFTAKNQLTHKPGFLKINSQYTDKLDSKGDTLALAGIACLKRPAE